MLYQLQPISLEKNIPLSKVTFHYRLPRKLLAPVYYRIYIYIGQNKGPFLNWEIFRNKRHFYRFLNWFLRIQRKGKFIFGNGNKIYEAIWWIQNKKCIFYGSCLEFDIHSRKGFIKACVFHIFRRFIKKELLFSTVNVLCVYICHFSTSKIGILPSYDDRTNLNVTFQTTILIHPGKVWG